MIVLRGRCANVSGMKTLNGIELRIVAAFSWIQPGGRSEMGRRFVRPVSDERSGLSESHVPSFWMRTPPTPPPYPTHFAKLPKFILLMLIGAFAANKRELPLHLFP